MKYASVIIGREENDTVGVSSCSQRKKEKKGRALFPRRILQKVYHLSLYLRSSLPRYNKGKKSRGGVVGGIWSVFDAERARLAVVRGRREKVGNVR